MNNYTNEILSLLKAQYIRVCGNQPFQDSDGTRAFYLEKLEDNLFMPMSVGAYASYGHGSGNEIETGKMNALRSSSAMTYNLFWDQIAEITQENSPIGPGVYQVEFEKQFHTLKTSVSRAPANLDAFLYCKHTQEAVACEMKLAEWLFNKPSMLKKSYLDPKNYITPEAGQVFSAVAKNLTADEYDDCRTEYAPITDHYDAFQMFKHAVACYTACIVEEPREIRKLTLVNCAWMLPDANLLASEFQNRYLEDEAMELAEFARFRNTMAPVKDLFADIGVEFDIQFCRFHEFVMLLRKTPVEWDYLRRYSFA